MSPQSVSRADVDSSSEACGQEPGEDDEVVIPADASDDESSTYQPSDEEKCSDDKGGECDGKDGRAPVREGLS